MDSLLYPTELVAGFRLKWMMNEVSTRQSKLPSDWAWSYQMLNKVSRSFAFVIQELPLHLRDPVCLFYLVLRGLDTIEDDMSIDIQLKTKELLDFYNKLKVDGWNFTQCSSQTKEDERILLKEFPIVINLFQTIHPEYQTVISDITKRMGEGMVKFLNKEVKSVDDYNEYCHYVAGLVGIGLSKMFAVSQLEDPAFANLSDLSNSMGLFLQKTNIIRDYLEDIRDQRIFWPREIWSKHAVNLIDFTKPEHKEKAVHCLNELITDALRHVPDCIEYMNKLRNEQNFSFCAIPQVMAIATLALCYENHDVFTSVVKLRRGKTAKIIIDIKNNRNCIYTYFNQYAREIQRKISVLDPKAYETADLCRRIIALTNDHIPKPVIPLRTGLSVTAVACAVVIVAARFGWLKHLRLR